MADTPLANSLVAKANAAIAENDHYLPDRGKAATVAVLRELAQHPEINRQWIADLADEIEGTRTDG